MSSTLRRLRVLHGLGARRGRTHRYTLWRWAVAVAFTAGVALLPATGTLRIDLWGGRHMWLGERVGTLEAIKAFAFPFLAVNVGIVLVSRFLGRWLCGFVCPVGNMNRLAEWFRWRARRARGRVSWSRLGGVLAVLATCFLLAAITFSFWVDWRVFRDGSPTARLVAGGFLAALTGGLFALVQGLGMRFCRDWCPSGVYFAVLGPTSATGVEFAHPEACTDCHACENVCPVDLKPREMAGPEHRSGRGFYPDQLTDLANCLRCGDCVAVCEATTAGGPTPLRLGWLPPGARGTPADEEEPAGSRARRDEEVRTG